MAVGNTTPSPLSTSIGLKNILHSPETVQVEHANSRCLHNVHLLECPVRSRQFSDCCPFGGSAGKSQSFGADGTRKRRVLKITQKFKHFIEHSLTIRTFSCSFRTLSCFLPLHLAETHIKHLNFMEWYANGMQRKRKCSVYIGTAHWTLECTFLPLCAVVFPTPLFLSLSLLLFLYLILSLSFSFPLTLSHTRDV